jgi:hypothetical protein
MKVIPAVTLNSKHKGILARAFGAAKSWLSNPTNFKKLIKTGASILPKLFSF